MWVSVCMCCMYCILFCFVYLSVLSLLRNLGQSKYHAEAFLQFAEIIFFKVLFSQKNWDHKDTIGLGFQVS